MTKTRPVHRSPRSRLVIERPREQGGEHATQAENQGQMAAARPVVLDDASLTN